MELEEAKRIINDFMMYCRFNEKRKYNDEQLFKAMEYFAYNDFIPKKNIEDKLKEINNINNKKYTIGTKIAIDSILQELLEEEN